jgi:hypothetical protein
MLFRGFGVSTLYEIKLYTSKNREQSILTDQEAEYQHQL